MSSCGYTWAWVIPMARRPISRSYYDTDKAGFDGRLDPTAASSLAAQQAGSGRIYLPLVCNDGAPGLSPLPLGDDVSTREISLLTEPCPRAPTTSTPVPPTASQRPATTCRCR